MVLSTSTFAQGAVSFTLAAAGPPGSPACGSPLGPNSARRDPCQSPCPSPRRAMSTCGDSVVESPFLPAAPRA
eukprot:scaffold22805_cov59-Phaeocystis_antarctica.AAC.15